MKRRIAPLFLAAFACVLGTTTRAIEQKDGIYQIGTSEEMLEFANLVNSGEVTAGAVLTSDVVYAANTMIGTGGKDYQGTFDGQGHRLTVNIDHQADGTAVFSHIGARGRVCNLIVDGTISGTTGIGTFAWESWGTLENCVSLVTLRSSATGRSYSGGMTCASHDKAVYRNCIFAGSFEGASANSFAGINYFNNYGSPTYENCVSAPVRVAIADGNNSALVYEQGGTMKNSYYTDAIVSTYNGSVQISSSALTSGELCFRLNGDQTTIQWTQTLGEDLFPYPFTSHKQVYSTAALNCGGKPMGDAVSFTNTENVAILPPHSYGDGFVCTVCGHVNEDFCQAVDGFYQIGTARQMDWLAAMINGGRADICARLTADIDWSASSIVMGTGGNVNLQFMDGRASENDYQGTFDGAGHCLTVNIDHQSGGTGLFAHIGANGKVCNIIIDGTISGTTGVGTFAWENWGTLENCVSLATLQTSCNGFAAMGGMTCASHGQAVYRNCLFAGKMLGEAATNTSGFNWSENGGNPVYENCASIPAEVGVTECFVWRQWAGSASYVNCYYTEAKGTEGAGNATLIDAAAIASGELCFRLNGDQSKIVYTQTLGEDEIPYPSTSHKQVYSTAALNCGGQPSGETSYSNTGTITELPPHTYDGGFRCQVCGHVIEDYVTAVDGFYPLGTSQQLGWFAYKVNSGGTSMNARLTADIDWTDFNMMIGTDGRDYQGTFDGQGHTITLVIDHQADGTGFFSHIGARGRVCNLILDGTITGTTGIGSFAWETWGVVENCVSRVTLRSLTKDFSSSYTGGLACATHDRAVFRNCLFEGALEGEEACGFAGFFYFNNLGSPTLENCVFAPREVAVVASGNYTLTFEGATINNCFCTYDFGDLNGQCKLVDAETMASGSVAWQLNGGRVDSPAWTQTLGEDPAPTPVGGHGVVYMVDETTYMSVLDATELAGLQNAISDMETERLADIVATRQLTDDFEALLNTLQGAADIADFNTAYKQWREDRKMLDENIAAWADYVAYVGEMKAFMKGRDGQSSAAQRMLFYLEDYEEPGDEFPNGTAEYILEACQLGTEGIRAERAFLTSLYNAVLASDYDRDMDITDLLVNPDFGQRGLGWSGQGASDYDTSRPVAECYNTSFNMTQTLTDLKPGIYEVRINGFFRPAGENGSRFYTAFLSAGDQQVPLMHSVVDAIAAADAVDMENCYITQLTGAYPYDEFYNTDYYIPGSMLGASYAFKGGRYVNRILAHVTDGTLQIGIRSDGTGSDKDWTVFANTRLYYRGTMDEAAETLAAVLEGQAARAGEILEGEVSDMEFARFPNFSKTLRDEMQAAIEAVGSVTDPAEMYALTERFSRLFAEVEDCQKAYVALMGRCYSLTDIYGELSTCGALTTEEYQQKINDILNIYDGWGAGAYSAAEAREMAEGMLVLPMEDDYYLISDATSLLIFAALVNQGQTAINAKVTADITEGISVIIGTGGKDYQGTFDGQGHKITLAIDHQSDGTGFFSHIGARGRVRNLVLDGTISGTTGIGSFAWESWGTLENCVSLVAIRSTATGNANSAGITCASREGATYRNCVFAGTIDCGDATNVAGFNWWANGGQPIYENCLCVPGSVTAGGYSAWSQQPENGVYKDCYYTDVAGTNNAGNARLAEKETLAGGEICYRFNGDQTTIQWTQTLGEDLFPYPFTTHSQVYPTTALNCGGQPIGDEFGYSNTPHTSELPPHTFVGDGFVCTVCGKLDEHYCEQQDGFYLIATARQMDWLAAMINGGRADICARLTADIDWSASSIVMGTGGNVNLQFMDGRASENDYQGTLDGAGHRLTVNIDHQSGGTGLFAHIGANGRVCNIIIDGTISGTTGVGTFAWENWGTLENCVSLATLRTSCNGFAAMGGMTCASHGQAVYRNCLFAGRLLGEAATNTSGFNWSENGGNPVYENCASIPAEVGVTECFVWRQWAGNADYANCYYTEAKGTEGAGNATLIDAAAVASGELCFRLNGDQSKIVYTQTLGEDAIPYPFGTHLKVVLNDDGTYGNDASGIASPTDGEMRNGTWYDVSGRRVERPVKGLYIRDGKVWMIK